MHVVARGGDAAGLRDLFRSALAARLEPAGWSLVDRGTGSLFDLAGFVRPLEHEFAATAEIGRASSFPDLPPVRITHVLVGVSYEPLRRLSGLLDEYRVSILSEDVHEVDDDQHSDERWSVKVANAAQVAEAVEEIAGLILDRAVPFAERYASLDLLLAEFGGDDDESVHLTVPALLAAAGRFDEARAALAKCDTERGFTHTRDARRLARQLGRWIESRGDPALLPSEPSPPRFDRSKTPSFSQLWRESRARDAAIDAVRRAGVDRDRDQLRSLIEHELGQRDVTASPLWIEQKLDRLHASDAERARQNRDAVKTLGKLGLGIVKAVRERKLPDLSTPDWRQPPDRAAYGIPRSPAGHWTAVRLDAEAQDTLDRVDAALPRLLGHTTNFEAWLDRDGSGPSITVHLGEHRVGTLDENGITALSPAMTAAGERDELPYTAARLTPRPDGYLLELQLPPGT